MSADMTKRKICVVTGSRAEYGLLYWLMREIIEDPALELQVAVTGMHLSPEFGLTIQDIEADGMPISACVHNLLSSDSASAITKSIGLGTIGFADAYARLKPDVVVVLGDRFEIFAAAQAALAARIPVAHIHGGELTEGAIDDALRHAITKLSHLHFVASAAYQARVIQLGEQPERVFLTGAPGLDHVLRTPRPPRSTLESELGVKFGPRNFLVTYHPATLGETPPDKAFAALLGALQAIPEAHVFFTRPNADTHGRVLNAMLDEFVATHADRAWAFTSLGQQRYLGLMANMDLVIGNSSSGLTEAPLMKVATINIGPRQDGRLKAPSVIDATETTDDILAAIRRGLSTKHQTVVERGESLYGYGEASKQIKRILAESDLSNLTIKKFFDLPHRA